MGSPTNTGHWTPKTSPPCSPTTGTNSAYDFDPGDTDDVEAVNAVTRITGGNFRLIERVMTQVARVMEINQLDNITPEVVDAARQILVIGTQ